MSALPAPVQAWLTHLAANRRYSTHTLQGYERDLNKLLSFAQDMPLESVTPGHCRQFMARAHADGLGPRSIARMLAAWRGFYQWHAPRAGMTANPVTGLRAPKASKGLPKALSVEQTQALLDRPEAGVTRDPIALRDQAMLELFYSSGLRLSELTSLDVHYVKAETHSSRGWLNLPENEVVVMGKGNKRRTVPVGRQAVLALQAWLAVRDRLGGTGKNGLSDEVALFLGARGGRISPRVVQIQLGRIARQAGLPTHLHPHVLRHSFASHLLQSAQDLRAVQELLGHANISTTQVYTRLDFQHLAQVYDKAHPRATRKS